MGFKFSKGSRVEVLNRAGGTSMWSWRCAEIVSGNGHIYSVGYDHCLPEVGSIAERVPRKNMRPCPPPMVGSISWVPGDVVEVFEDGCWKPAQVLKVVDRENYFFVSLLGLSRELRAHRSHLRLRQSWKDNIWAAIEKESADDYDGKDGASPKEEKTKCRKFLPCSEVKRYPGDYRFLNENDHCFEKRYEVSSEDKKKGKQVNSHDFEAYTGSGRKVDTAMGVLKHQRLIARHSAQILETVDAVSSPQIMFGENDMHDSLKNSTSPLPDVGMNWGNPNVDVVHFNVGSQESSDSECQSSSVGSSSPSYSSYRSGMHLKTGPDQVLSIYSEDAEAPCGSGREHSPPRNGILGSKIHRLELNAYRSTLVALYASGPFSWEQEALLTNLRIMLHITNDEHLLELKYLATIRCNSA